MGVLAGGPLVVGWGFQPGDPFEGAGTKTPLYIEKNLKKYVTHLYRLQTLPTTLIALIGGNSPVRLYIPQSSKRYPMEIQNPQKYCRVFYWRPHFKGASRNVMIKILRTVMYASCLLAIAFGQDSHLTR